MPEYFEQLRRKVGRTKILVPGTGAIILDERGDVLLMLRADNNEWGIPGGFMDLDETVRESLRRELREELDIAPHDETLFGMYSGSKFDTTHPNGDETAGVTAVLLVPRFSGTPRNSDESRELRFFAIDELPSPMNSNSAFILDDYRKHVRGDLTTPVIL